MFTVTAALSSGKITTHATFFVGEAVQVPVMLVLARKKHRCNSTNGSRWLHHIIATKETQIFAVLTPQPLKELLNEPTVQRFWKSYTVGKAYLSAAKTETLMCLGVRVHVS